ncbi:MAG: hypothetical protein PHR14_05860 [Oscillospiraceae bacterium]|nr:hypothetical protein [Oscillospiraceae bacterium]
MAINTIALSEKMTGELDKAVVQKAMTGFLADNAMKVKFVGVGTVLIPNVEFSGLGDYDRDGGFAQGSISVANTAYELAMDRGRSFMLDAQDCDETGIPGLAGQVMGEFVRTKVIPEMDAYVLSKLGALAEMQGQTVIGQPATEAFTIFNHACNSVYNNLGYDEELVAFIDSTMWAAIQNSPEISRSITLNDFKQGGVDMKVKSVNGVYLLPMPDSRMKTDYIFYDGRTPGIPDQTGGGFVPATGASNIGLLVMPRRGASLVKKTEKVRIFDPDKNQQADAWKFDYRLYYDLIVKESLKAGVVAYIY